MAADLALFFAVTGWLLTAYGTILQMGDPAPWVSRADIKSRDEYFLLFIFSGMVMLQASIWLSGVAYSVARWRALIALSLCVLPVLMLFGMMVISF